MAKKSDQDGLAAWTAAERATSEYFLGDPAVAKLWATQALALFHDQYVAPAAILAFAGDIAQAQRIIDDQAKARSHDTYLNYFDMPQVRQRSP